MTFRSLLVWLLIWCSVLSPVQAANLLKMGQIQAWGENHRCHYPINFMDPMGLDRIKFISGKYTGWRDSVQFNASYVNQNIKPKFEGAGHTFSLSQGAGPSDALNAMFDNDLVYISAHGNTDPESFLDFGHGPQNKLVASHEAEKFASNPYRAKIVIAGSCDVGANEMMADALGYKKGSGKAFIGWDEPVFMMTSDRSVQDVLDNLLNGMTVSEAIDKAGGYAQQHLRYYGDGDVRLGP